MNPTVQLQPESLEVDSLDPSLQTDLSALQLANVKAIRALTPEQLFEFTQTSIPQDLMPTPDFMGSLSPLETTDTPLLACLLIWTLSNGLKVPREFQLRAGLAAVAGQNTVVRAETGQGKTLAMAISMLLRQNSMAIVVSPLKRLQSTQVNISFTVMWLSLPFNQVRVFRRYGIRTLEINDDTPNDELIWKVCLVVDN
jgi:DEAD/DEAH box helicase